MNITEDDIKKSLPKLYWELLKVKSKLKFHPFSKSIDNDIFGDAGFPVLDIFSIEDILDDIRMDNDLSKVPIINISNNCEVLNYNLSSKKWLIYNPILRELDESNDKVTKKYILDYYKDDLSDWKELMDKMDNVDKSTKNEFFDYIKTLIKEVNKINI